VIKIVHYLPGDNSFCSPLMQMLRSTFGELLKPAKEYMGLPSPELLKEKILMLTKPPTKMMTVLHQKSRILIVYQ